MRMACVLLELDEISYRQQFVGGIVRLTDFWRVGERICKEAGRVRAVYDGRLLPAVLWGKPTDYHNEDLLYRLFGVNAELLIDSCMGLGTLYYCRYQGIQAAEQQRGFRPGTAVPVSV